MTDRDWQADKFMHQAGWGDANRRMLAGDASNRTYWRLKKLDGTKSAVLMDAAPECGEDVRPFLRIARHLTSLGLSAPAILAEDAEHGFLLLEDLGDDLFARVIETRPDLQEQLYRAATDLLVDLHATAPPDLTRFTPDVMSDQARLVFEKYAQPIKGHDTTAQADQFVHAVLPLLEATATIRPVLLLRDYHAENLIWLPDRAGNARVGLLDFQDAVSGHPAYDLVSLLQDARRDVPKPVEATMIQHYLDRTGLPEARFRDAYALMGTMRNLRIIGIFARLATDHGKPHYLSLIPRVWGLLMRDLAHPSLENVADVVANTLPTPTPDNLQKLIRS